MTDEFQGHVRAQAAGEVAHGLHAACRRVGLVQVNGGVGAEGARQPQARGDAVNGDYRAGAAGLGYGGGVEPQTAGALDGHAFAGAQSRPVETGDDLRHRAVDAGDGRVGQAVRHQEHRVPRVQVVVLREGAAEVGPMADAAQALALSVRTGEGMAAQTDGAAAAGVEVAKDDAVAFAHGLAAGVRGYPGAQPEDFAHALVAEGVGHFEAASDQVGVASPVVQVRPADVGEPHLEDDGTGGRIGNWKCKEGEGLADSVENGHDPFSVVAGQAGASS